MKKNFNGASFKWLLVIAVCLFITNCAPAPRTTMRPSLEIGPNSKIKIGDVTSSSNEKYQVDAESMLRTALNEALMNKGILGEAQRDEDLTLSVRIMNYEMGNAFKRWVLPFYGSTVLNVECMLADEKGEIVSKFNHKRSIAIGGFYTVGGWKAIFDSVARDIAVDIKRRMTGEADGFIVELDPWLENESNVKKAATPLKIKLKDFLDIRSDKERIGERHAAFGVSMGNVYLNREVDSYINETILNELIATGYNLTSDENIIELEGEIVKFWLRTNVTALYWDVIGEIEINLKATNPDDITKSVKKSYSTESVKRTYVYPSKKIVKEVMEASLASLMEEIRDERIWERVQ